MFLLSTFRNKESFPFLFSRTMPGLSMLLVGLAATLKFELPSIMYLTKVFLPWCLLSVPKPLMNLQGSLYCSIVLQALLSHYSNCHYG